MSFSQFNCWMILLTLWVLVCMVCMSLNYQSDKNKFKKFMLTVVSLTIILVFFFITDNLLLMYMMFEASLIPTFYLILSWGYQPERLQAGVYFMMYTIVASLPLLMCILLMKVSNFSLYMMVLDLVESKNFMPLSAFSTFWPLCILTAFLVKIPMWGVHIWLPKAHVEAPISGSMILAGLLLKMGGYGMMKMLPFCFGFIVASFVNSINLWAVVIVSLVCMSLVDIKSLIAYTSVIHMALMTLALMNYSEIGRLGAMLMMICHGLTSPMMFSLAYINYKNTHTRNLLMHKGINSNTTPLVFFWFLALAANMSAPTSLNLVSEIIISFALVKVTLIAALVVGIGTMMSGAYNLYLYSAMLGDNKKVSAGLLNSEKLVMTMKSIPTYGLFMLMNSM
uniref:NADH dehydrogenase subunit 4 n=1 Tax=Membranipora villosa TaxID=2857147 RepID=UPI002E7A672A|nr:NADH dehydrogenase subunit 4 [Membranipora villosa]WQB41560.1 NADH dehydrogenase subunit 4 [Membranipora villosa]